MLPKQTRRLAVFCLLVTALASACTPPTPLPTPTPAPTPTPTTAPAAVRRVAFARQLDERGCVVELGDRYLPGERIHLVVELTGPPDTVVATQWYEPQGQSVIAEMEYELAPDFTGCVHFDLQPVQPDEIPLGAYRARPRNLSISRRSRFVGRPAPRSRCATGTTSSRGGGGGERST